MTKFSANLGFLWTGLPLPDAIHAAKRNGFDAVECHWPYETPAETVRAALEQTGLEMLGINTARGDVALGENGLAALPDKTLEAREAIDQALGYASAIRAHNVHVMAGNATGMHAHQTFVDNLRHACKKAAEHGINILIEPLNTFDAPEYFLTSSRQAQSVIEEVGKPNLKLMFDCYHLARMGEDITERLEALLPVIGHIQFAGVPGRGSPDKGDTDYKVIFDILEDLGYDRPLGAEYKPEGATEDDLDWMKLLR